MEGRECYAGLDLSTTTDITALVLAFPSEEGVALLPFFFAPEDTARERERRDKVPYTQWAHDGFLELTPGNVVDYEWVKAKVRELGEVYQIRQIAFDPWNATQTANDLMAEGIDMVKFRQGFISISEPAKRFERLVMSGELTHPDNPVLNWMVHNVAIEIDSAENIKPSKKKSHERIDGVVAAVMGLGLSMVVTEQAGSVYEERGLIQL